MMVLFGWALTQARPGMGGWQLVGSLLEQATQRGGSVKDDVRDPHTTDDDGGSVKEDVQRSVHGRRRRRIR